MQATLADIEAYLDGMPGLPVTIARIEELVAKSNSSPIEIAEVISLDPVLVARLLRVVNSAFYGASERITSVARAVIMLGLNTVRNLVLAGAIVDRLNTADGPAALNLQGFWRHSLAVGILARRIAQMRGLKSEPADGHFIAGLLHDIGKIPINNVFPNEFVAAMTVADQQRIPIALAEKQLFHFDHTDTGRLLAERWRLGDQLKDTIVSQGRPLQYSGQYWELVFSVHVAGYWATDREVGFAGDRRLPQPPDEVYQRLGVSEAQLEAVSETVGEEVSDAEAFLGTADEGRGKR